MGKIELAYFSKWLDEIAGEADLPPWKRRYAVDLGERYTIDELEDAVEALSHIGDLMHEKRPDLSASVRKMRDDLLVEMHRRRIEGRTDPKVKYFGLDRW